jgi:hypothetical protein
VSLVRSFFGSTGGKTITILLVLWLAFQAWTALTAPAKLAPELHDLQPGSRVDLAVELNFPPERFHILELQEYGRLAGARENVVNLRRVSAEDVMEIARIYWVKSVSLRD